MPKNPDVGKSQKKTLEEKKATSVTGGAKITDLVLRFPKEKWDWKKLTESVSVPIEFMMDNHKFPWDWFTATEHTPFSFIQKHVNYKWDWDYLSENVQFEQILANQTLPWN